jgi:hypothetical protein
MANILTSWKEIANHVGKGVRTVQRWERQFGFPVRRPNPEGRGIVIANAEEIDLWLRSQRLRKSCGSDQALNAVDELRRALCELQAENEQLRRELHAFRANGGAMGPTSAVLSRPSNLNGVPERDGRRDGPASGVELGTKSLD